MMSAFFKKYQFWFKCWGGVWALLTVVFSFYMFTFFLGNHDWQFIRYDMPLTSGLWEARITQFVPPWLFSLGRMLPIWNTILGFMFLSGASVLLAWWYGLKPKMPQVLLFSLLIGLHPYVCSQLYYVHTFVSIGCWHFLAVLGLVLAWQFAENHKFKYFIGTIVCLWCAVAGYAACIELILVLAGGRLLLDVCRPINKGMINKWMVFGLVLCLGLAFYVLSLKLLKYVKILDLGMYNTQTLPFLSVISRFIDKWQMPFVVLNTDFPYIGKGMSWCFWWLVLIFNLVLWRVVYLKKYIVALLLEAGIFYAAFVVAYVSPFDVFYMFRVHAFSVPYLVAVMLAFIFIRGLQVYRNLAYVIAALLLCYLGLCDLMVQKVWYLGNGQDDKAVERLKQTLLPQLGQGKHYRMATIGNLYGRQKFAAQKFVSDTERNIYREYYGFPYFLDIFFSQSFFAYEPINPIWGDAAYLPVGIFYGRNSESILPQQKSQADAFAEHFSKDSEKLISSVRRLKAYPRQPYYFIEDKDIVLMLGDTAQKDVLIEAIKKDM